MSCFETIAAYIIAFRGKRVSDKVEAASIFMEQGELDYRLINVQFELSSNSLLK